MGVEAIGGAGASLAYAYSSHRTQTGGAGRLTACCGQTSCTCGASEAQGNKAASSGGVASLEATEQLSPEEQQQVQRLKATDLKVRQHEQAHLANAAGLSMGGASFQYVRGPDGRQYAVAGEVRIDVSAAATPEQTIDKAQRIRAAALAPADPSSADRAVAAAAAQLESQARAELAQEAAPGGQGGTPLEEALKKATQPEASEGADAREYGRPASDQALQAYSSQAAQTVQAAQAFSTFSLFA